MKLSKYVMYGRYATDDFEILIIDAIRKTQHLPVQQMYIADLESNLNDYCWSYLNNDDYIEINPINVLKTKQPEEHWKRILKADLSYPIIIYHDETYDWFIVDGTHRLAKAKMLGLLTIDVKITTKDQLTQ